MGLLSLSKKKMCLTGRRKRGRPYKVYVYILDQHQQTSQYSHVRLSVCQTDKRTWQYRYGFWCWSRISILYGVCHAFFCLLHTFFL